MGIKKAKTKEVRRVSAGDLPQAAAATVTLETRLPAAKRKRRRRLIDGSPKEAAAKLVEKLKFEVRVI